MATNVRFLAITVNAPPPYRGGTVGAPPRRFFGHSINASWTWSSEPSTATLVYFGATPVSINDHLTIAAGGHVFYGRCVNDKAIASSGGNKRSLSFVDNRDYLSWDDIYCAFNKPHEEIIDGSLVRRYKHLLPDNSNGWIWTYTDAPYTAAEVLDFIFESVYCEDNWVRVYHSDQTNFAVLNIDAVNGGKIKNLVQDITDKQGLVFTLMGGPFRLVWARKGEGILPAFPADSDDREIGLTVSGHPTRIRVLGDRNRYQVHNITMERDWANSWQQFYDFSLFVEDIYQRGATDKAVSIAGITFPIGTPFKSIGESDQDKQQIVSRQLALAKALSITVGQYALLRGDASFNDHRKFAGRSRMEIPAALYIENLIFRAFKFPSNFTLKNAYGRFVPLYSLTVAETMLAKVTHDPATGEMTWDATENPDGRGYAIAQGYQVGKDMFRTITPERFNIQEWLNVQNVWERIDFEVDQSGEGDSAFIIFSEPVIRSSDLVEKIDDYAVFKAAPTFTVPPVKLAVAFDAERFFLDVGAGTRDDTEVISGLGGHFVGNVGQNPVELEYYDGKTASQKAQEYGSCLLNRQAIYDEGNYFRWIQPNELGQFSPTLLTGRIDRITVEISPSGLKETVRFTSEYPRKVYVPERDLERGERVRALLPGQPELRDKANAALLTAAALSNDPRTRKTVQDAFNAALGLPAAQTTTVQTMPKAGQDPIPAGTLVWGSNEKGGMAGAIFGVEDGKHVVFAGVTARSGESHGRQIKVVNAGPALARVQLDDKPMKAFTELIAVPGTRSWVEPDLVVASTNLLKFFGHSQSVIVAYLLEDLPAWEVERGEEKLAKVFLCPPQRVSQWPGIVKSVGHYLLRVESYEGDEYLVMKPQTLMTPPDAGGVYERVSPTERKVQHPGDSVLITEQITPLYDPFQDDSIMVQRLLGPLDSYGITFLEPPVDELPEVIQGLEDQFPPLLIDTNTAARRWERKPGTYVRPPNS